jgi:gluconate 2-dehydrogenase alpha chain
VGRHFTAHVTPVVHGLFSGMDLGLFSGPWAQATCVDDFNGDAFDHSALGFVSGGMVSAAQEIKPIQAAGVSPPPGVPRWGAEWKDWILRNARSVGTLVGQFDSLTYDGHQIDLDPTHRDAHGLPVVRVTFAPRANELRGSAWLADRLHEWLRQSGATTTWQPGGRSPVEGRHAFGGTRMGDDPATSVVDGYGFAHEVGNLAVVGASTFPTAGGVNPTLTLQALALRTARHLVETWDDRVR